MKPEQISEARHRAHLSQEALAQEMAVDRSTVTRWENGTRRISGAHTLLLRLIVRERVQAARRRARGR